MYRSLRYDHPSLPAAAGFGVAGSPPPELDLPRSQPKREAFDGAVCARSSRGAGSGASGACTGGWLLAGMLCSGLASVCADFADAGAALTPLPDLLFSEPTGTSSPRCAAVHVRGRPADGATLFFEEAFRLPNSDMPGICTRALA